MKASLLRNKGGWVDIRIQATEGEYGKVQGIKERYDQGIGSYSYVKSFSKMGSTWFLDFSIRAVVQDEIFKGVFETITGLKYPS